MVRDEARRFRVRDRVLCFLVPLRVTFLVPFLVPVRPRFLRRRRVRAPPLADGFAWNLLAASVIALSRRCFRMISSISSASFFCGFSSLPYSCPVIFSNIRFSDSGPRLRKGAFSGAGSREGGRDFLVFFEGAVDVPIITYVPILWMNRVER